jgi:hypothetical protein
MHGGQIASANTDIIISGLLSVDNNNTTRFFWRSESELLLKTPNHLDNVTEGAGRKELTEGHI